MGLNEKEIRKAIEVLHPDGELFEVRAIDGKWNASGYFRDADTLIQQLQYAKIKPTANIYNTLNAIKDDCYSRKQHDKIEEYANPTTTDADVIGYNWLMIDLDPVRTTGVSSSDAELAAAKAKANDIYLYMQQQGWSEPAEWALTSCCELGPAFFLQCNPAEIISLRSSFLVHKMVISVDVSQIWGILVLF